MGIHLKTHEKILVHLYNYRKLGDRYEYPPEITQQGIGKSVGISVTHVPRNIARLIGDELVVAKKGHVPGKKKRITVYFLTEKGIQRAREIIDHIDTMEIEVGGKRYRAGNVRKRLGIPHIELIRRMEKGNLRVDEFKRRERVVFREIDIEIDIFVNRVEELKIMKKWYEHGKILAIIGSMGYGKSSLIQKFIERTAPRENIVWLDIYRGRKWKSIEETIRNVFDDEIFNVLRKQPTILILDNYFDVDDMFVEALKSLVRRDVGKSKIIVTMRPDTPFYNRFYTLSDVVEGRVIEIKLEGLSYENSKLILPDVKEFAFRRIYQLTKGNPWILNLLKSGKIDEKREIPMSAENIHLLKYLASQKKN